MNDRIKKSEQTNIHLLITAIDLAVGYAIEQWEYKSICKGKYSSINHRDLVVKYNARTMTLSVRHWLNPFMRMKESLQIWLDIIGENV